MRIFKVSMKRGQHQRYAHTIQDIVATGDFRDFVSSVFLRTFKFSQFTDISSLTLSATFTLLLGSLNSQRATRTRQTQNQSSSVRSFQNFGVIVKSLRCSSEISENEERVAQNSAGKGVLCRTRCQKLSRKIILFSFSLWDKTGLGKRAIAFIFFSDKENSFLALLCLQNPIKMGFCRLPKWHQESAILQLSDNTTVRIISTN